MISQLGRAVCVILAACALTACGSAPAERGVPCDAAVGVATKVVDLMANSARDEQARLRALVRTGHDKVFDTLTVIKSYKVSTCAPRKGSTTAQVTIVFEVLGRVARAQDKINLDFVPEAKVETVVLEAESSTDGRVLIGDISTLEPHVTKQYATNVFRELENSEPARASEYRRIIAQLSGL